jgi:short-subunit dehydrogenase
MGRDQLEGRVATGFPADRDEAARTKMGWFRAKGVAMFTVPGSIAVVTGASSGIGRRLALELAGSGATVVALARREERLVALAPELQRSAPESHHVVCDVSDTDAFTATLGDIEDRHGRIDILVNNAAISEPAGDGLDRYRRVMETNYFAVVAGTLAVLPGMRARRRGAIVNVSSDTARAPTPGEAGYAASKAALSAFTEALSYDAETDGVFLHVLYPGWVPTEMTQSGTDDDQLPPRFVRRTPEQVARVVVAGLGKRRVELDATRLARIAPVARTFFPSAYRRGIRASLRG